MEHNIINLAKYLVTKDISSPLKIQKILFFLRFEELNSNIKTDSFFKKDKNFQAWIYGPVNVESFKFLQGYFDKTAEKEMFLLNSKNFNEVDKIYGKWVYKYNDYSGPALVSMSHQNLAWIKARGNLGTDEICKVYLVEDENFTKFKDAD